MMIIIFFLKQRILAIHGKRILGQVIGSDSKEIHTSGKLLTDHYSRRSFHHNARSDIFKRNPLTGQLSLHLPDQLLNRIHFLFFTDHWIHHPQISVPARTVDGANLCFKQIFPVQAKTDSTIAHKRICFLRNLQIGCLFICTKICCSNDHQTITHGLCRLLVCLEKLFLSRVALSSQVLELTSKQSDSPCAIIKRTVQVIQTSDICINSYFLAIQGDVFFIL